MEYYPATKKKEIVPLAATWMDLEIIIFSEGSQIVCVCVCAHVRAHAHTRALSCSVMSDSLWLHGLYPSRLLCLWNFPGKITGVECHFLLQGIFPIHISCISCIGRWILYD